MKIRMAAVDKHPELPGQVHVVACAHLGTLLERTHTATPGAVAVREVPGGPEAAAEAPGAVEVDVPPGGPSAEACPAVKMFVRSDGLDQFKIGRRWAQDNTMDLLFAGQPSTAGHCGEEEM